MSLTAQFIQIVSVIAQYGMLLWLLYFVTRLVRYLWTDFQKMERQQSERAKAVRGEAVLTVLQADDSAMAGRRFAFSDEIAIGRGSNNDIVLQDAFVSHHHAIIMAHNNQYVIEDLGSANHTYVNGKMLQGKAYLQAGDEIRIGMLVLRFER